MKIQLSENKIVNDALAVWSTQQESVDIVMDLKNLTFKPASIEEMYSFHVLDHLFPEEIVSAVANWFQCLKAGGKLFIVVDDFEYVARGFVGGDLSISLINQLYNHPTQFSRDLLVETLQKAGFKDTALNIWLADVPEKFLKKHYELVIEATK